MATKKAKRVFDKEFKVQAARLVVDEGRTRSEVGRNLDVNANLITRWVKEYLESKQAAFPGKGKLSPVDEENRRLRDELRRVTMERDILKKATAYFAQASK